MLIMEMFLHKRKTFAPKFGQNLVFPEIPYAPST